MIGSRIQEARKRLGMSQEELAEKLGLSQRSISKYENDSRRPSYEALIAMSSIFGVSTDYLLGNTTIGQFSKDGKFYFVFFFDKDLALVFRKRIDECLKKKDLDLDTVSRACDIPIDNMHAYYEGEAEPSLEHLMHLAQFFKVSTDYLLGLVENDDSRIDEIAHVFSELDYDNKDIVMGKAKELLREQKIDSSVAADENDLSPEIAAK